MVDRVNGLFAELGRELIAPKIEKINDELYLIVSQKLWRLDESNEDSPVMVLYEALPVNTETYNHKFTEVKPIYFLRAARIEGVWQASKEEAEELVRKANGDMKKVLRELEQMNVELKRRSRPSRPPIVTGDTPEA
jgi:hypothetical protein